MGSYEYPQSMFWSKNKKNRYMYTPAYPSFAIQKWGSRGYTLHRHVFMMELGSHVTTGTTRLYLYTLYLEGVVNVIYLSSQDI